MTTGWKNRKIYEIIPLNERQAAIMTAILRVGESSVNRLWEDYLKNKMAKDTFLKELKNLKREGLIHISPFKNRLIVRPKTLLYEEIKILEAIREGIMEEIQKLKKQKIIKRKSLDNLRDRIFYSVGYRLIFLNTTLPKSNKLKLIFFSILVNYLTEFSRQLDELESRLLKPPKFLLKVEKLVKEGKLRDAIKLLEKRGLIKNTKDKERMKLFLNILYRLPRGRVNKSKNGPGGI